MTIPVLICDDSALARKQVKKSLPDGWDIDVNMVSNGREAIDYLRQNQVGVLFLDLTMPEIDGVGVLETNKAEKLVDFVIVVSADIQPDMKKRVEELGALAFINKPVNTAKLNDILKTYGLL
ncbi:response regulator [Saccharobesus litoralis]|uniref:Response regulator n=1 Tax=Saccharobesus litoralis TaxID=2172099 RepID=A0A2S0VSM6_9ALTE|nr:response regulator [Saccharobesus litoralis]AWB67218.1 response regulator [Saccharobesus litoralis]